MLLDDETGVGAVMLRQIFSTVLVFGYQLVSSVYRCRLYLAICIIRSDLGRIFWNVIIA
jgi:hypothetical protein